MKRTALACTLFGFVSVATAQTLPVTEDAVFSLNDQALVISRTSTADTGMPPSLDGGTMTAPFYTFADGHAAPVTF